jgi:predicted secreted hydrolase
VTISRVGPALALLAAALLGMTLRGAAPGAEEAPAPWRIAEPGFPWHFPRDHWAHPGYKTEWWYFTGHLTTPGENQPRFGYQFTFFRVALAPGESRIPSDWATHVLVMGHASISDLRGDRHVFSDVLYRDIPLLGGFGEYPDSLLAWCRGPAGTEESWTLLWNGEAFDFSMADRNRGFAFRLSTRPDRPLVFQGPGGYSRKGAGASQASLYYSFTRLRTSGTMTMDGEIYSVSGQSWMDKEFGSNQLAANQVGWDWFSLQLDDGRDIMIYELRDAEGGVDFSRGTLVSPDGSVRHLERSEWTVHATDHWRSPRTGIQYPARWEVNLPYDNRTLRIRPIVASQENEANRSGGLTYWEGAVEILGPTGSMGRGYVELTGYGARNRPIL